MGEEGCCPPHRCKYSGVYKDDYEDLVQMYERVSAALENLIVAVESGQCIVIKKSIENSKKAVQYAGDRYEHD